MPFPINTALTSRLTRFFLILILGLATSLHAENLSPAQIQAKEIYAEFYSPFCPGRVLQDCPSTSASELKNKILQDLEAGISKEVVINNLLTEYGNELSALPKMQGFALLAWLIPLFFLIAGGVIIFIWLRASRSKVSSQQEQSDHIDQAPSH